jgi:hypothetical protein
LHFADLAETGPRISESSPARCHACVSDLAVSSALPGWRRIFGQRSAETSGRPIYRFRPIMAAMAGQFFSPSMPQGLDL